MNKNWFMLVIMAVVTILGIIGYEFYISITGGNSAFSSTVTPITNDLGTTVLNAIKVLDRNVPVRDEALDNK